MMNIRVVALIIFFFSICFGADFWQQTSGPEGGSFKKIVRDNKDNLYAISHRGYIFKSSDGKNWEHVFIELSNINDIKFFENDIYVCFYNKLFTSNDNGQTWWDISPPKVQYSLNTILIWQNEIFLAGRKAIHKYDQEWQVLIDSFYVEIIELNKNSKGTMYAATAGYGLLRIVDGTYQRVFFDEQYLKDLLITANDDIYIASDNGLYKSKNDGFSWQRIDPNLNNDDFTSIEIRNNIIYTSVEYGGVYSFSNGQHRDLTYNLPATQVLICRHNVSRCFPVSRAKSTMARRQ